MYTVSVGDSGINMRQVCSREERTMRQATGDQREADRNYMYNAVSA